MRLRDFLARPRAAACAGLLSLPGCGLGAGPAASTAPQDQLPHFTPDGALLRPTNWDSWVMVGASTGLSYSTTVNARPGAGPGMFHNVYLQPWAYRHFVATGTFPQGAMFVLAFYEPSRTALPARAGFYEGDAIPVVEVHLKKAGVDSTGWGFYNFGEGMESSTMIPGIASCYSCHAKEAQLDHVFVQFYPALRRWLASEAKP